MAHKNIASFWATSCLISLSVLCIINFTNGNPTVIHNFRRIRREAETPQPEPESSQSASTPSSMSMSTMTSMNMPPSTDSSVVPDHIVAQGMDCGGNVSLMMKSCPDNGTCPMDDDTMEKCCYCLNTCCGSSSASSEEGGMMIGSSTVKPGKDLGSKVKDAVNSAEGWIKNAGQNIKNSWNKAKDSISHTASDVSDKVKKGVNSIANRVRNATSDSNNQTSECTDKDANGKCTTVMFMSTERALTKETSSSSTLGTENTTRVPGFQKSKRDLSGRSLYSPYYSPSVYDSRYSSRSGLGSRDMDNSDSREFSWSRSTTTTTGSRDSNNRRYKREKPKGNGAVSVSFSSSANPEKSEKMYKRATSSGMVSYDKSGSPGVNYSGSMSRSSGNGRQERDIPPSENGRYVSSNGGVNNERSSQSRTPTSTEGDHTARKARRSRSAHMGTTEKSEMANMTTVTSPSRKQKRGTKVGTSKSSKDDSHFTTETPSNEDSDSEDEESSEGSYYTSHGHGHNGKRGQKDRENYENSNFSVSVTLLGPQGSNESRCSFLSCDGKGSGKDQHHNHDYDIRSTNGHNYGGGSYQIYGHSSSAKQTHVSYPRYSHEDFETSMGRPPLMYPDGNGGGVISGPQNGYNSHSNNGDYNNYGGGYGGESGNQNSNNPYQNSAYNNNQYGQSSGSDSTRRKSNNYSNRGGIRSSSSNQRSYEPMGSSSTGVDVAYSPYSGSMPGSALTSQTNSNNNYNRQYQQHRNNQDRQQQNHQHYPSGDQYGWNGNPNSNSNSNYGNSHGHTGMADNNFYGDTNSNSGWGNMNSQSSQSYPGSNSGMSSSNSNSLSNSDLTYRKPGRCRPLANGVHCLNLGPNSAQCLYDKDCSGSKKCCFYGCSPNQNVGICEPPADGYGDSSSSSGSSQHGHGGGY